MHWTTNRRRQIVAFMRNLQVVYEEDQTAALIRSWYTETCKTAYRRKRRWTNNSIGKVICEIVAESGHWKAKPRGNPQKAYARMQDRITTNRRAKIVSAFQTPRVTNRAG